MKELNENVGSVEYDELINSGVPELDVCSVTVRALTSKAEYKRGTVLAVSDDDNKAVILGTTPKTTGEGASATTEKLTASYILADDTTIGTTDTTVVAYRTGNFNRNKLIVAASYTITSADEDALRQRGIILNTALKA